MNVLKGLWIDILYPMLSIFLPCIIYQITILRKRQLKGRIPAEHFVWCWIFILYLFMALNVSGIDSIWHIGIYETIIRPEEINFILFSSAGSFTYILNIIMFMPLGFLLPLIWTRYRNIGRTILAGAGFSAIIEILQLFNKRTTDIDDLLMNILGTAAGFGIWAVFSRIFRRPGDSALSLSPREPVMYIVLSVLGRFLLCNTLYFVRLFYF